MQPASTKTPCDFYVCKYMGVYTLYTPIHPYTYTPQSKTYGRGGRPHCRANTT